MPENNEFKDILKKRVGLPFGNVDSSTHDVLLEEDDIGHWHELEVGEYYCAPQTIWK